MKFLRYIDIKSLLVIILGVLSSHTAAHAESIYHCAEDSTEIRGILRAVRGDASLTRRGDKVLKVAEMLLDRGADDYYAKDSVASLRVNVHSFTPMTFVNTVLALALTAESPSGNQVEFENHLTDLSCRRGENAGFASIMWHSSDWIVDNIYRGNLMELTENYTGSRDKTKSLDYYTRHKEDFAALADADTYEKVRMIEMGFRTHRLPFLPKQYAERKDVLDDMADGDILVMISNNDGEDVYQIGIISKESDGLAHLIHFDPKAGKVVKEQEGMKRYFNLLTKYFGGFRWLRLK